MHTNRNKPNITFVTVPLNNNYLTTDSVFTKKPTEYKMSINRRLHVHYSI